MEKTVDITMTIPELNAVMQSLDYALAHQIMTNEEERRVRNMKEEMEELKEDL